MPDLDGFQVPEALGDELPASCSSRPMSTRCGRSRCRARLSAQPIEPERYRALAHVRESLHDSDRRLHDRSTRWRNVATRWCCTRGKVSFLKPSEIDWVEADGKHALLHAGKETHVVRQQLQRRETRLSPHGFVRVHRSAIVNVERIKELEPWFHGEYVVILKDGTKLTSSAAHSEALHRIIDAAK